MAAGRGVAGLCNIAEREHWDRVVGAGQRKRGQAHSSRRVAVRLSRWYWQVLGNCEVVLERK